MKTFYNIVIGIGFISDIWLFNLFWLMVDMPLKFKIISTLAWLLSHLGCYAWRDKKHDGLMSNN